MGKLVYTGDFEQECDEETSDVAVLLGEDLESTLLSVQSDGQELQWDPMGQLLPIISSDYDSDNCGSCTFQFHLIDAFGSQRAEIFLAEPCGVFYGPRAVDWMPGGTTLAFNMNSGDVLTFTLGEEEPRRIYENPEQGVLTWDLQYSPSGERILLVKDAPTPAARFWLIDSDGSNPRFLFERKWPSSTYYLPEFSPTWLSDNEFLFKQPRVGLFHADLSGADVKITQILAGDYESIQLSEGGMWVALVQRAERGVEIRSAQDWQLFTTIEREEISDAAKAVVWSPLAPELAIVTWRRLFLYQLDQDLLSILPSSVPCSDRSKYLAWGR